MDRIRLASITGDDSNESHLVLKENESKERAVLRAFPNLNDARLYAFALVDALPDCEQGFPAKTEREKATA
jgi:hypothetical protein